MWEFLADTQCRASVIYIQILFKLRWKIFSKWKNNNKNTCENVLIIVKNWNVQNLPSSFHQKSLFSKFPCVSIEQWAASREPHRAPEQHWEVWAAGGGPRAGDTRSGGGRDRCLITAAISLPPPEDISAIPEPARCPSTHHYTILLSPLHWIFYICTFILNYSWEYYSKQYVLYYNIL